MQHHGAFTRLLDWSESLAAALYFAVLYDPDKIRDNPCIWVSNAYRLNQFTLRKCKDKPRWHIPDVKNIPPTTVNFCVPNYPRFDYATVLFAHEFEWPFEYPFVMESPYSNSRLRAQKGLFTVHGTNTVGLEAMMPSFVQPVILANEEIDAVRAHLKDMGVTHYSFFPDFDGLAQTLNETYFK
jgi:hypothetical protein